MTAWLWAAVPAGFLLGILVGRFFSTGARRIKALKGELEQMRADLDRTKADLTETRGALERARAESAAYHGKVTEHFVRAADLFNSLTVNYRAVYEHLANSSIELCDEHMVMLSEGVPGERRIGQDEPAATAQIAPRSTSTAAAMDPGAGSAAAGRHSGVSDIP